MDTYTFDGSKPNLISNKTIKDIESRLDIPFNEENKVIIGIGSFYNNYILPNMFPIIVISLLALYLTIKYVLKKDREEKDEEDEIKYEHNKKTKKLMLKTDIDELLKEKENYQKYINKNEKEKHVNKNKSNISDLISDDYLLSDESIESDDTQDIRYDTQDIRYDTQDIRYDTQDIRYDTQDIKDDTQYIKDDIRMELQN
jgi:large-conductance mechanosensitive channel